MDRQRIRPAPCMQRSGHHLLPVGRDPINAGIKRRPLIRGLVLSLGEELNSIGADAIEACFGMRGRRSVSKD